MADQKQDVAEEPALKIVGEIGQIKLEADDVLIVTCPGKITDDIYHRIAALIQGVFPKHTFLILADGTKIEVARKVAAPAVDLTDEMVVRAMEHIPGCNHDDMVSALEAALDLPSSAVPASAE